MADVTFEKFRNDFGPQGQLGREWPFLVISENADGTKNGWLFGDADADAIYTQPQFRRGIRSGDAGGQLVGAAPADQQPQPAGQLPGFVSAGEPPRAVHLPPTEPGGPQRTVYPPGPENPPALGYGPGRAPDLGYAPGQVPPWVAGTQAANPAQNAGATPTAQNDADELQRLRAENQQLRAQLPGAPSPAFTPGGGPSPEERREMPPPDTSHFNG